MHVLWLIPGYWSFIVEELKALSARVSRLSVVLQSPPFAIENVDVVPVPADETSVRRIAARTWHVLNTLPRTSAPRSTDDARKLRRIARYNEVISDYIVAEGVDIIHSHFGVPEGTCGWQALGTP